jgi:predicted ATPase/class 3 adenylate cyclase
VGRELPQGIVTFLFTDVEGSTRLLHELGAEAYAQALAEHRRVIREACSAQGGVEVDTQGDAFFFAFPTAPGALAAAAGLTEALASGAIRVRVGLHTGTPLVTEEGYIGEDVHLAARVGAAAHGGQVVLSQTTRVAGADRFLVIDLGEHRLKDVAEAVSIFQLGEGSFPPLKTISNTNLPRPASSFVGRERERRELLARLEGARLVTLTGPGGSGKTRLALEAAAMLVPEYKAGVFWVGLAALRDPALVMETIAQTLGAKDGLAEHIGERELLLLLDNLEQVIEAAPELVSLVERCPNLALLVTSRERLRVRGEVEYPVPPLADPEAVALFCERSQLEPSEEIAELCARLDSLPLGVELAAARTKALTPGQILERLSQRLDLLQGGRDADPRQQTLRATIEWSYDLLPDDEQLLFARLSVFAGGCTLEAAEEVADADLDTLQSLVDKSLLRFTNERYWMLETVREYAGEQLEDAGEADDRASRHLRLLLATAEYLGGDEWLRQLDAERDNVRAVLEWALAGAEPSAGLELAATLERFWWVRGPAEGLTWLERGLAERDTPPAVRAAALNASGTAAWFLGHVERAHRLFEEALPIFREAGDQAGVASVLTRLGPPLIELGRVDEAVALVEEGVALNRELGKRDEVAMGLSILSGVALDRGDLAQAQELLEESTVLMRRAGDRAMLAWNLNNLAEIALRRDELVRAERLAREGLTLAREFGDDLGALLCLAVLAVVASKSGDPRQAGLLWGAAERLDTELGDNLWRRSRQARSVDEERLERDPEFERARSEGNALSLDAAVEVALAASLD